MSKSRAVMMVIYDLSVKTASERKTVDKFRKVLIRCGYISLQKSVYVKLIRDISNLKSEAAQITEIAPKGDGNLQLLPLTVHQFRQLTTVKGNEFNMSLFADDVVFV